MNPKSRSSEQHNLLRPHLTDMMDLWHEVVKLAVLIDRQFWEKKWAGFFPSHTGRPATSHRLVSGPLDLKQTCRLSDESVVARWVENPCDQHFCGAMFSQNRPPVDGPLLKRLWNRIGEEGAERLLTKTIEAERGAGVICDRSTQTVIVD